MFERLNRALRATRLRAAGFAAALATCAMLLVLPSFALAQQGQASFDHAATGFPLLGAHEEVRCETCHIKGIFKGTPRECALCHVQNNQRGALAKPVTHIQTLQTCDSCHSVASFRGAMFSHVMVALGSCSSCHNGIRATGKSANHIATTASCDQCHSTIAFTSSLVPANHIPTAAGAPCSACHTSSDFSVMPTLANIHANAPSTSSNCEQCHGAAAASFAIPSINFSIVGMPSNHIPTGAPCEACHVGAGSSVAATPVPNGAKFSGSLMSHTGITSNCAQCHGGAAFFGVTPKGNAGLTPPHIPTTAACEACHSNAIPSTPIPVTGAAGATFANGQMSHTGIASNCVACHGPSISGSSFAGITSIVVMPPTSPEGPSSHIPSSTTCESCHLSTAPVGLIAANATKTAPGTAFATPAPTTAQIHAGVTSGCNGCHESAGPVWMGMSAYPITPTTLTAGAQYTGFHARPRAAGGTYNVADAAHPNAGDCSQCHSNTNSFTAQDKPANHIPTSATAQCAACHTTGDFAAMPTLANIHANAPSTSSNCAQCHGAAAPSFAIPAANFSIVGMPGNHIPTSAACEACHVGAGSSVAATPVPDGAKFSGSLMSHTGITSNCAACHGPSISGSSFAGITSIVVMPPISPEGPSSHIPSSTTCETCHLGTVLQLGKVAANAATTIAPGTKFATPAPTTAQIHSGVTSGCSTCHESNGPVWMGMSAYPIAPTTLAGGAQFTGFQTRPRAAAGTFNVADAAHPASGDCSQCHGNTNFFSALDTPANHIPTSATAQCTACHTSTDFSVMPTLANIHANAPSTTANCAQCHGAAAASFAIPSANFAIVGLPSNHIPTSVACESCHVGAGSSIAATPVGNGAKFSGSLMDHTGITSSCAACHGPAITSSSFAGITRIVVMPATSPEGPSSHIPSSTTCETCHLGTVLQLGKVAANATTTAPGTKFATPAPTTAQIHSGVTSGCSTCHESNGPVWMGMSAYPIAPTTLTSGAQYTGFQTRPRAAAGTFNVADAAHPGTGDCSQCHSGTNFFSATDKPANHIPTSATAACSACHTSSDFSVMPTLANIHANAPSTTANCAQCHGAAAPSFAIPAANFAIVGLPAKHIPTSAACEACHVGAGSSIAATPVPNGAKFSGSLMSHTGITSNCAACHGPAITSSSFAGITRIVVMPATSPAAATSHIPSSTSCETCHLGTVLQLGKVAANAATTIAPGTKFATPAPTTAQIHSGITSGCSSCHDTGFVWMGMSTYYPIAPTTIVTGAQYTGFHTRPVAAASTFSVADAAHPLSGDCSVCHSGTNFFSGQTKPAGHIPTNLATCSTCHVVSGDFSVAGLTTNMATMHTGITSGCIACHTAGTGGGPFAGCTTQAACASPPPLTYQPKTMPLAAGASPTAPSPLTHVPAVGIACERCHAATVFTSFAGMNMKGNATAHGAVYPPATCISCHEGTPKYQWFGALNIVTRPVGHEGRKAGQDCIGSGCHRASYGAFAGLVRPVIRSAITLSNPRLLPDGTPLDPTVPSGTQRFNHQGVLPGQCTTCHNGQAAKGLPPKHFVTRASCDTCHRTTAWIPAQFNHQGVLPGQCYTCHNGTGAPGKSSSHFVTARSCDACHRTIAWVPTNYSHLSPAFKPQPDKTTCVSCHITNGEIVPRQLRGNPRPRPIPQ